MQPGRPYTIERKSSNGTAVWGKSISTTYRQKKPYRQPLPFLSYGGEYLGGYTNTPGFGDAPQSWVSSGVSGTVPLRQSAYNKAYERFVGQLGERGGWAETAAQRKQTGAMLRSPFPAVRAALTERHRQDLAIERSILRLIPYARQLQKARRLARWKGQGKRLGNAWLELHFGWQPLMQDVYNTVALLRNPLPRTHLKSRSYDKWTEGSIGKPNEPWAYRQCEMHYCLRGWVEITDSDMFLLNMSGLANPATLAWQLVPYSFVVDWFANMEQVLNSISDFVGVRLSGVSTTVYYKHTLTKHLTSNYGKAQATQLFKAYCCSRGVGGLSPPRLALRKFNGFSPTRGLTAIALLNKFLK